LDSTVHHCRHSYLRNDGSVVDVHDSHGIAVGNWIVAGDLNFVHTSDQGSNIPVHGVLTLILSQEARIDEVPHLAIDISCDRGPVLGSQ